MIAIYRNDLIDQFHRDRVRGQFRNEIRGPALHQVRAEVRMTALAWLGDAAADQLRVVRLAHDDLNFGALLLEHPRDAFQRAAGAIAGDPIVQALSIECRDDFRGRRPGMHIGVGFVFELAGQEPAMRFGQFLSLGDHTTALLRRRRQHHLGAEKTHHLAPLDTEAFGHRHDQRVPFLRADHCKANTGVATGCLDDGLSR